MSKKILYVHGLGSGAGSRSAGLLDKYLKERTGEPSGESSVRYQVLAPEIPQDPIEAIEFIRTFTDVDLIAGSSMGGFYALTAAADIPRVVINPCLFPSRQLEEKIGRGTYEYFCPRSNGRFYTIDDEYLEKLSRAELVLHEGLGEKIRSGLIVKCIMSTDDELLGPENADNGRKVFRAEDITYVTGGHRMTDEMARIAAGLVELILFRSVGNDYFA